MLGSLSTKGSRYMLGLALCSAAASEANSLQVAGTGRLYFLKTAGWYMSPSGPMSSGTAYTALPWETCPQTQAG